jgi:hypothetical protein
MDADFADIPPHTISNWNVDLSQYTDWCKFIKLDAMDRPGLTEDEFFGLFLKCEGCKLIMHVKSLLHQSTTMLKDNFEPTDAE